MPGLPFGSLILNRCRISPDAALNDQVKYSASEAAIQSGVRSEAFGMKVTSEQNMVTFD